ncbi:MAG: phosphate ABC transporter permease PstA [Bacteroidia bacterium]|nr:phosphate ABC transporter permease PstA [Bacteroidia bacterium]MCX7764012.1 phosphate ABC transporter permease PstA [Bacteroidia bacterium]MDW8058145.1 phosphate ABC transporter permease PstA [Bacteroidia bacterium]
MPKVRKRWGELLATLLVSVVSWGAILVLGGVVGFIAYKGASVIGWSFLTEPMREGMRKGGIAPAIVGSLWVTAVAVIVGGFIGTAAGAYLSEFATNRRLKRAIEFLVTTLAGIPSVVYGLFGLALFVVALGLGASILAGGLTLALLSLPLLIRNAQEAFSAVPASLKEASLGLGASEMQTFLRITLPIALPRVLTGLVLATGRVLGETAPILFTVAAYYLPTYPRSLFEPTMLLPYHLYVLITSGVNVKETYPMAFGTALTLLMMSLAFTLTAAYLRFRLKLKYRV